MIEDSLLSLSAAGFHRIAYTEHGDPDADRVVVCVHGLTRNGRDFDRLAGSLATEGCRVVCPDMAGRGRSDWLAIPELYDYPQYLIDLTALIARLGVAGIDWIGTSMGGLAGMMIAAQPKSPIRRLVINDIGPFVPKAALERIGDYVGTDPVFEDIAALEAYLRFIYQSFGELPADAWAEMAEHAARLRPDGRLGLAYDPAIGNIFRNKDKPITDIDLWPVWDSIRCPVLALHGVESDLLLPETCREMSTRGPEARIVDIPGTGHAPGLMVEDQIAVIRDFLLG